MKKTMVLGLLTAGVMAANVQAGPWGRATGVHHRFAKAIAKVSLADSNPASDNASDPAYTGGGDFNGKNGGTGFGAWVEANFNGAGGGFSGTYVGATADGNPAFGLFASATGDSMSTADSTVTMTRPFTGGALGAGQTFSLTLATSSIAKGSVGINLLDGSNNTVFTLIGTAGTANWQLNDGGSNFDAGAAYAASTLNTFTFTYNGGSSYSFTLTGSAGGNNFTAANTISGISGVKLFVAGLGNGENAGFNNLAIVPEPSTLALLAGPVLLGGYFFLRRRRAS